MEDVYKNCPIYENENYILRTVSPENKNDLLFHCNKIAAKVITSATERMIALKDLGFRF